MLCAKRGTVRPNVEKNKSAWTAPTRRGPYHHHHHPRTQTLTLRLLLLLLKIENCFFIDKKRRNVYVQKKIKDESVFTKKDVHSSIVFCNYLQIFTKNVHSTTVFIAPPPPPHSPPPMLPSSGCDGNTGRSPASKNPNGSSGTCTAGDRPVPRTRSSRGASGIHLDSQSD